jgi:hypothetical protein
MGVGGRVTLNWSFREEGVRLWTGFVWFRTESGSNFCEYGNELSGSIKGGKFLI